MYFAHVSRDKVAGWWSRRGGSVRASRQELKPQLDHNRLCRNGNSSARHASPHAEACPKHRDVSNVFLRPTDSDLVGSNVRACSQPHTATRITSVAQRLALLQCYGCAHPPRLMLTGKGEWLRVGIRMSPKQSKVGHRDQAGSDIER